DKIKIVELPDVPDKGDISDWLNRGHTKEELWRNFKSTPTVKAEELKSIEPTDEEAKAIPTELQDRLIHPALHIEPGFASFGVVQLIERKLSYSIVTSSGGVFDAEKIKDGLSTPYMTYPDLAGRWTQMDVPLTLADSVALLICKMRELISFEDERWYYAAALWC